MTMWIEQIGKLEHSGELYWLKDPEDAIDGVAIYASLKNSFAIMRNLLVKNCRLLSGAGVDHILLRSERTPQGSRMSSF